MIRLRKLHQSNKRVEENKKEKNSEKDRKNVVLVNWTKPQLNSWWCHECQMKTFIVILLEFLKTVLNRNFLIKNYHLLFIGSNEWQKLNCSNIYHWALTESNNRNDSFFLYGKLILILTFNRHFPFSSGKWFIWQKKDFSSSLCHLKTWQRSQFWENEKEHHQSNQIC